MPPVVLFMELRLGKKLPLFYPSTSISIFTLVLLLFSTTCSCSTATPFLDKSSPNLPAYKAETHFQEFDKAGRNCKKDNMCREWYSDRLKLGRRYLMSGRLGSSPPRCTAKCGTCSPCMPVHVPVPPGPSTPIIDEYYPEAWRCKCRNRLYIP